MLRKPLLLALAAVFATLLASARVQAWGGIHAGITSVGADGTTQVSRAHWDPYVGQWVGGRFGPPVPERGPYSGLSYGSPNYADYGGYLDNSVYAAGLRTNVWTP